MNDTAKVPLTVAEARTKLDALGAELRRSDLDPSMRAAFIAERVRLIDAATPVTNLVSRSKMVHAPLPGDRERFLCRAGERYGSGPVLDGTTERPVTCARCAAKLEAAADPITITDDRSGYVEATLTTTSEAGDAGDVIATATRSGGTWVVRTPFGHGLSEPIRRKADALVTLRQYAADELASLLGKSPATPAAPARPANLTEQSFRLFLAFAEDAGNWSGTPMVGGNVELGAEGRGNLTQLKKAGLITTFTSDGDAFVDFTTAGVALAAEHGHVIES